MKKSFSYHRIFLIHLCIFLTFILIYPANTSALSLYFIYPEGEGDTASAQGILDEFFTYLKNKTGIAISGLYLNDADEAADAFKDGKADLAIVAPDFFAAHQAKASLTIELKTVPAYATGAHEKFYLYCGSNMIPSSYAAQKTPVQIFASRSYRDSFIESLLDEDPELRNITFRAQKTSDLLGTLKAVGNGENTALIILSGYENSVIEKFRKTDTSFAKLKLILTSKERPSAPLVNIKDRTAKADMDKIRNALLEMGKDPEGKKILETLRLSGFEP